MKSPRLLLGSVVLFWGWQVQTLWIAVLLSFILESAHLVKTRFELMPSDFNKFVDISTVLLAGTVVVALTMEAETAIRVILKWLPLVFFPIICAQEFSSKGKIDARSFFLMARKKLKFRFYKTKEIDMSYIYSLICILSAGTANTKGHLYYSFAVFFFIWALWQVRSKRTPFYIWLLCMVSAAVLGYIGHKGIRKTSLSFSRMMMEYYADYYSDPFKTATAMGEIGKLKLSDKIVLRVKFEDYIPGKTYLLHKASYNLYNNPYWFARSKFTGLLPQKDSTYWQINPAAENTKEMTIYSRPKRNKAVLSLPSGVVSISQMFVGGCEKNTLQSVRVEDVLSLIKSVVTYVDKAAYDEAPEEKDLLVPKKELPAIEKVTNALGLENRSEKEILNIVKQYFLSQYTYSLDLKGKGEFKTPLQNFFYQTKSGHCEFFATATALILRQLKMPARYATGFIAHEFSNLENQLIVRQRDAHAWVKVYVNGQWENFDTTPPSFLQLDSQEIEASFIKDVFSFLGFKLSQLRHETGGRLMNRFGLWLILPLGIILFFRLRKTSKIKKIKLQTQSMEEKKRVPQKVSFHLIEEILSQKGFPKYPYETYCLWLQRLEHNFQWSHTMGYLQNILKYHNRYRFSKSGLTEKEKIKFDSDINIILKQL